MRNPDQITSRAPMEWGRRARKAEAHDRGFRRRGRLDAITEQLADMTDDGPDHIHIITFSY